jgi:formylglycine-generating enzyme required for sulfatase activity
VVRLDGGTFAMGSGAADIVPTDGESPVRQVRLSPFRIGSCAVSNDEFTAFVDATGYRTDAEAFGWSYVFDAFLPDPLHAKAERAPTTPWWCAVPGAYWRRPDGPGSDLAGRGDHPVVHVSWADAAAYAAWVGGRLPSEAEWEFAARGGLHQARFPWGDELTPGGEHRCNIWQGTFPAHNAGADGYLGTAPVNAYRPNGFGLYNTSGNVWEWCGDYWSTRPSGEGETDPRGPAYGNARVTRGGSYLCHVSYCNRYRVSARTSNTPDTSTGNLGFRVAWDA